MLVLKRPVESKVSIELLGRTITVTVTDVGDGWAKLGFEAPPEVMIVRDDAKCKEPRNRESDHASN